MKLKEIREKRGLNQRQLAEAMHIPQSLVSAVENGKLKPYQNFMEQAARVLGEPIEKLFPKKELDRWTNKK